MSQQKKGGSASTSRRSQANGQRQLFSPYVFTLDSARASVVAGFKLDSPLLQLFALAYTLMDYIPPALISVLASSIPAASSGNDGKGPPSSKIMQSNGTGKGNVVEIHSSVSDAASTIAEMTSEGAFWSKLTDPRQIETIIQSATNRRGNDFLLFASPSGQCFARKSDNILHFKDGVLSSDNVSFMPPKYDLSDLYVLAGRRASAPPQQSATNRQTNKARAAQ